MNNTPTTAPILTLADATARFMETGYYHLRDSVEETEVGTFEYSLRDGRTITVHPDGAVTIIQRRRTQPQNLFFPDVPLPIKCQAEAIAIFMVSGLAHLLEDITFDGDSYSFLLNDGRSLGIGTDRSVYLYETDHVGWPYRMPNAE